ncbi:MAG: hypothetical protein ACREJC_22925, partial [Tepidisphaeraceae bacterium]
MKFQNGNKRGLGDPLAGCDVKIRAALRKTLTQDHVKAVAQRLIDWAKSGERRLTCSVKVAEILGP